MIGLWLLLAALLVALAAGLVLRRHSGSLRSASADAPEQLPSLLADLGFTDPEAAPLLLHFSASWCGPCAGVRQVVQSLAEQLPWLRHLEVDVAQHPQLAATLRVLSLPTVLVYDVGLHQRWRVAGVPSAPALRAVLLPLAPGDATAAPTAG